MGNHWSGPHPWPTERKTFVESCRKSPARSCPRCGRPCRFVYAPFKFKSAFEEVPEPTKDDWACRICHDLVYRSQYPKVWENDHKRTFVHRLERIQQFCDQLDRKYLRRAERNRKNYEKAQKLLEKRSV